MHSPKHSQCWLKLIFHTKFFQGLPKYRVQKVKSGLVYSREHMMHRMIPQHRRLLEQAVLFAGFVADISGGIKLPQPPICIWIWMIPGMVDGGTVVC